MKKYAIWLFLAAALLVSWLLAGLIGPWFELSGKVALLIAMVLVYVAISLGIEWYRYRLRIRLERMPAATRAALAGIDPEIDYAIPAAGSSSPRITTLVGAIAINGMVIPLMVGPLALFQHVFGIREPGLLALAVFVGFFLAWAWWSVGVTVWRWWATTHRGMPPNEVQWRGEGASLLWPQNHPLEKTELGYLLAKRKSQHPRQGTDIG